MQSMPNFSQEADDILKFNRYNFFLIFSAFPRFPIISIEK